MIVSGFLVDLVCFLDNERLSKICGFRLRRRYRGFGKSSAALLYGIANSVTEPITAPAFRTVVSLYCTVLKL